MAVRIIWVLLLAVQYSFGQSVDLTRVPGTKCSLVPPPDFTAATNFNGFLHTGTGASIMVNELPVGFQKMTDGFTAEALKTRGMTLISKESIDFNNGKAVLIKVTQPANGTTYLKQILLFGDETVTVMVNGIYPESAKSIEQELLASLLTTVYTKSQDTGALEAAPFSINTAGTGFIFVQALAGSLLYSADGKIPTEKPTLIVGSSLGKVAVTDQQSFSLNRLKQLPGGKSAVVKNIQPIAIDHLNGYEIIAEGKDKNDKAEMIYQVMLFTGNGQYYIIVGQANEDFVKYQELFKNIAISFARK